MRAKSSKYTGVSWNKRERKWVSTISVGPVGGNTQFFLGHFDSEEEAARAYDAKAIELHGPEYRRLNFVEPPEVPPGTRAIQLTRGYWAIVDEADYEKVKVHSWQANKRGKVFYAQATEGDTSIQMHRLILDAPPDVRVDHINHDGLDNRRSNLRLATHQQNCANRRKQLGASSRFKGVSWHKKNENWTSYIRSNGVFEFLGSFTSEVEAAKAYNKRALEVFGTFACLNPIEGNL